MTCIAPAGGLATEVSAELIGQEARAARQKGNQRGWLGDGGRQRLSEHRKLVSGFSLEKSVVK